MFLSNKNKFEDAGKELMNYSKTMFLLSCILGAACAFIGIVFAVSEDEVVGGIIIAAGVCGIAIAYISSVFIFSFGQLVSDVREIKNRIYK